MDHRSAERNEEVTVFAPATIGNIAVGYDVLGCAIRGLGDRVTVRRVEAPGVHIGSVTGRATDLPTDPSKNTASASVLSLFDAVGTNVGLEVSIEKGIPLGSGLGGSGASAVGGVVAAAALLRGIWSKEELLPHALAGEAVATGDPPPDNVAPCLFGGLILARASDPPDVISLPVPSELRCVLVSPDLAISTRDARACLPETVPLADAVRQSAHLGAFVAGCYRDDLALVGRSLRDLIVEPHRADLVPGFADVQAAAFEAGALGCSLSGAGPTMFAWCEGEADAHSVRDAMVAAFQNHEVPADAWTSPVSAEGARIGDAHSAD